MPLLVLDARTCGGVIEQALLGEASSKELLSCMLPTDPKHSVVVLRGSTMPALARMGVVAFAERKRRLDDILTAVAGVIIDDDSEVAELAELADPGMADPGMADPGMAKLAELADPGMLGSDHDLVVAFFLRFILSLPRGVVRTGMFVKRMARSLWLSVPGFEATEEERQRFAAQDAAHRYTERILVLLQQRFAGYLSVTVGMDPQLPGSIVLRPRESPGCFGALSALRRSVASGDLAFVSDSSWPWRHQHDCISHVCSSVEDVVANVHDILRAGP